MACYYGLKIIKDLGLPVSKRVRFVVGTDEESGWQDMDYYFKHVVCLSQTLVSHQMRNFQSLTVKKGISQNISTLVTVMMAV